ncbi:putative phosphoenolpyruvate carboxylase [Helianthus annuus]|nr:putative phosphoenolpyruvate carboxylase [Helianthus annuus]
MTGQVEAHHYCGHLSEEMRQCLIYNRPDVDARLIGLEYKVTEELFLAIQHTEKPMWHSHEYEFFEPLELCYISLCACGDRVMADGSLLDFLRQVSTFGLSLVKLDIRQESERHTDVLDAITQHLEIVSYRERSEEKRQEWF